MNAQRRSVTSRQAAERSFPYRVDIPVPPLGLGPRLNAMLDWCAETIEPGDWAEHGWEERRGRRVDPKHWARFYFMNLEDAGAFERLWGEAGN